MKQIVSYITLFVALFLAASCKENNKFKVSGVVSDAAGQTMYLENVGVSSVSMLDSVKLNEAGEFEFIQPRPEYPDFFRLRLKNQLINFAIDSTESINIQADGGTFATSYKVDGSENCKAIKTITLAQLDANQAIEKLRTAYEHKHIADSTYKRLVREASDEYKNVSLKYIFAAPMSTVAYYALFQQVNGLLFFDLYDKKDSRAYGAVATSFDRLYPESARSKQLHNLALQSIKVIRGQRKLDLSMLKEKEISMLDIELPDLRSNSVKLSDVAKDHPVIVNFTAYQAEWSPALNMELNRLFTKYSNKNLQIYQISLDADKHFWMNAASNLPWFCVRDPQTVYSKIASLYNVTQLPAIFIIDKTGNIAKRVENHKDLERDLKAVL